MYGSVLYMKRTRQLDFCGFVERRLLAMRAQNVCLPSVLGQAALMLFFFLTGGKRKDNGNRVIPLNQDAMAALMRLGERAQRLFGCDLCPDWYVFPHAEGHTRPDPTKPMSGWRSAWRKIRNAAGLTGLRFHDLRHQAITELAESQASDQTIMSIAGHVSPKMLSHYSHVRLEAKRHALDAISTRLQSAKRLGKDESYGTNNVTTTAVEPASQTQPVENLVSAAGFEPATHALKGHCSTN
jgi:Phage integrase family